MMDYMNTDYSGAERAAAAEEIKKRFGEDVGLFSRETLLMMALTRAEAANQELREQVKEREMALALACDLHGCVSTNCTPETLKREGVVMYAQLKTAEAELARLRTQVDEARDILLLHQEYFRTKAHPIDTVATDRWLAANPGKESGQWSRKRTDR